MVAEVDVVLALGAGCHITHTAVCMIFPSSSKEGKEEGEEGWRKGEKKRRRRGGRRKKKVNVVGVVLQLNPTHHHALVTISNRDKVQSTRDTARAKLRQTGACAWLQCQFGASLVDLRKSAANAGRDHVRNPCSCACEQPPGRFLRGRQGEEKHAR